MRRFLIAIAITVGAAWCGAQTAVTQSAPATEQQDQLETRTLADLLSKTPVKGPNLPGFYEQIPDSIVPAVRLYGEENYTSAIPMLQSLLEKTTGTKERTRVMMWLGLILGQEALDYEAWSYGTSATEYLRKAVAADPEVYEASDVARTMAEMIANGWSDQDPSVGTENAVKQADKTHKALDYYAAGIMKKREAAKAWAYRDTTPMDRVAFQMFAKSVAKNPERYENWSGYLPSMMPVGLHDLMGTETERMFTHFKDLRNPLIGDQGPASLYYRTRMNYTMQDDEDFFKKLEKEYPDAPYGYFQAALFAIETTPSLAISRFEDFVKKVQAKQIKLQPKEQGYYVSALYKLGFLVQNEKSPEEGLKYYDQVKAISPTYAEVNSNVAALCGMIAEKETTGPKKLALLEKGVAAAKLQEKWNYRGKATLKANEMSKRFKSLIRAVKKEMETSATLGAAGGTSGTLSTNVTSEAVGKAKP